MILVKDNKTQYVVLGLLNHEPLSGYDIKQRVELVLSQFWSAGFGQIYPTLQRLLAEEKIVEYSRTKSGGPERILYAITPSGRQQLVSWLESPEAKEQVRYELLLKLFFSAATTEPVGIGYIESFKARYAPMLQQLSAMEAELAKILDQSEDHLNYYLTARFGTHVYQAYLNWAEEALQYLNRKAAKS